MSVKKSLGMGVKELLKIALKEELEAVKKDTSDKAQADSKKESSEELIENQKLSRKKSKQILLKKRVNNANLNNTYQQAIQAYKENKFLFALIKFATLLDNAKDDPRCWNNLGVILFESGAEQLAKECFQKALQIDPENQIARENLAQFEDQGVYNE